MNASTLPPIAWQGIWPALLTPLQADLSVDLDAFARHSQRLLDAGCTGLTLFGTTGEGPSFSVAERVAAVDGLIARGIPAQRLLVSTSCAALPDVVALTRHAVLVGAHASLLLPPFFLKGVPDPGVIDFYSQVIDAVNDTRLKLVLYHIPQIAGVGLSHDVIRTLLGRYPQTIIGIKDSGCQREPSLALAQAFMPPMQVWVGNEPDLQVMAARGTRGAVSGVANIAPRLVQRMVAQADGPRAAQDLADMQRLLAILTAHSLTPAFKAVMAHLTGEPGWARVRAPLVACSAATAAWLRTQVDALTPSGQAKNMVFLDND
jgi:4-hydroxy-tetrahydrodipicolinate synthase